MLEEYPKNVIAILARLIAIESESSKDNSPVIALLSRWFVGYQTYIDEWIREKDGVQGKNLIVKIPGKSSEKSLVFLCHIDTVPPSSAWETDPFILEEKEGKLYGLGACDTKGGVASLMQAVFSLTQQPAVDTYLVFDGDEESTWTGAKNFQKHYAFPHPTFIAVEPTDATVCLGARSILECTITTHGISTHASFGTPEVNQKKNAIYKMNNIINVLIEDARVLSQEQDALMGSNSQNIGMILGGTARNVLPDTCTIALDRRLLPTKDMEGELLRVKEMIQSVDQHAAISSVFYQKGFRMNQDTQKIKHIVGLIQKTLPDITIGCFQAMSEVTLFQEMGECIVLGPGSISLAHRANEYIPSKELFDYVTIYRDIIEATTE